MSKNKIIRSILIAQLALLVPLVAMVFTEEVNWTVSDFIVAGLLLAGIGTALQMIVTGSKNNLRLTATGVVLVVTIAFIWVELAVGIFRSPFAGS